MNNSKRIRIAMVTNDLNINGISTVILNYSKKLDSAKFEITILAGSPVDKSYFEDYKKNSITIIELPPRKTKAYKFYTALWKELSTKKYDIVHVHGNSATMAVELSIAMLRGIAIRIAHCHNSTCNNLRLHRLLMPIFRRVYTYGFACSSLAGNWLFGGDRFYIIPNGFEINRFKFDCTVREKVRQELKVENKLLIGHVGRYNRQKNHLFLLDIFKKVAKINSNAYLVLIGDGPDFKRVNQVIQQHTYADRIIVYGETSEVEKIYNAMDVFVLTSNYEGLGIVLLEAQMNGLSCVSSNSIPKEAIISKNIRTLSLSEPINNWADIIMKARSEKRELFFENNQEAIRRYDINKNVHLLSSLYVKFLSASEQVTK